MFSLEVYALKAGICVDVVIAIKAVFLSFEEFLSFHNHESTKFIEKLGFAAVGVSVNTV